MSWRVGESYPIHVYEVGPTSPEEDRPVATFLREEDARRCVRALEYLEEIRAYCREVDDIGESHVRDTGPTVAVRVLELAQQVDKLDGRYTPTPYWWG